MNTVALCVALMLAPRLAAHFETEAPGFDWRIRPLDKTVAFADLDAGRLDAAVGTFAAIPARFFRRDLFEDAFVCIARKGHPALRAALSARRFAEVPQVLMTLSADGSGAVDQALRRLGLDRRVALTVGQFVVIPDIVARTDMVAVIPRSVADRLADRAGCSVHPLPIEIDPWTVTAVWSQGTHASPAKRYAIEALCRLAGSPLPAQPPS